MVTFDLQLFGGKGSKVTYQAASVPAASDEEKALLQQQVNWANQTQPVAQQLLNMSSDALSGQQVTPNPNWQTLYNNAQAQTTQNNEQLQSLLPQVQQATNTAADANSQYSGLMGLSISNMNNTNQGLASQYQQAVSDNNDTMTGLANGELPSQYAANRQQALQSDLTNTVGSTLSNLASRGVINSSQADSAIDNISKNASNTLASNYSTDMQTAAGLANQKYSGLLSGLGAQDDLSNSTYANNINGYGQQAGLSQNTYNNALQGASSLSQLLNQSQQFATDPISTAATAQEASINVPMQYLAMATGQDAPTQSLLSQLSSQRYSMASPAQTIVQQGSSGLLGGLTSGLSGLISCFVAGTPIALIHGAKAIDGVKAGDQVVSLGTHETVEAVHDMGEKEIVRLETTSCKVNTTETEVFMTPDGMKPLTDIAAGTPVMTVHGYEPVTVIKHTGKSEKVYELTVSGLNVFYAGGILAEGLTEADKAKNESGEVKNEAKPARRRRKAAE